MDSAHDTRLRRVGCPIRRSPDQSLLAAPRGLSQRATSFIASWRQGIHQMPLLSSTHPSDNRTLAPRRRAPSAREGGRDAAAARAGDQATTCKKHTHAASTHAPDGREGGRASICLPAPARARRIDAQRPASMPANGLSSPLHDVKDQATVAGGTSPRQEAQGGTRFVRAGAGGEGVPLGFRGPDGPGRAPWRRGPTRSRHGTMVGLGRLERPTSRLSGVRSNQLSYRPESHPQDRAGPSTRPGPQGAGARGSGRSIGCAMRRDVQTAVTNHDALPRP
jgi:hypothetical protein